MTAASSHHVHAQFRLPKTNLYRDSRRWAPRRFEENAGSTSYSISALEVHAANCVALKAACERASTVESVPHPMVVLRVNGVRSGPILLGHGG